MEHSFDFSDMESNVLDSSKCQFPTFVTMHASYCMGKGRGKSFVSGRKNNSVCLRVGGEVVVGFHSSFKRNKCMR